MFNPFKGTIRKVKAGYITSALIAAFYIFGIDFDEEQSKVLENLIQALIVFVPTVIAFYTKMTRADIAKVVILEEKAKKEEIKEIQEIRREL